MFPSFEVLIFLLAIGFLAGVASALLGVGGGFIMVPAWVLILNLAGYVAVGTSLTAIIAISAVGVIIYLRRRRVDYRFGLPLASLGLTGAILGAYLTVFLQPLLEGIFGVALLAVSFFMISGRWGVHPPNTDGSVTAHRWLGSSLIFLSGVAAGLLGVGGGFTNVPVLVLVMSVPMSSAVGTSLLITMFAALAGTLAHTTVGGMIPLYTLSLMLGGVVGAPLGARVAWRLSESSHRRIFGLFLSVIGAVMVVRWIIVMVG